MNTIVIRELRCDMLIGIHADERHRAQTVSIDLDIGLPAGSILHDELQYTIDYEQVALRIGKLATSQHFGLVETFVDRIASMLIHDLGAEWVKATAGKVGVIPNARFVGVCVERRRAPTVDGSFLVSPDAQSVDQSQSSPIQFAAS